MNAGSYYVGDLCYVLKPKNGFDWRHLLNATDYLESPTGMFVYKNITFFSSGTAHGDGCYRDNEGRKYCVDAGLIGCFPVNALGRNPQMDGGHVVEFDKPFDCIVCDDGGVIRIGRLTIKTS